MIHNAGRVALSTAVLDLLRRLARVQHQLS
jgi:hypothetical protein